MLDLLDLDLVLLEPKPNVPEANTFATTVTNFENAKRQID